jgi:hypothetical protein
MNNAIQIIAGKNESFPLSLSFLLPTSNARLARAEIFYSLPKVELRARLAKPGHPTQVSPQTCRA